MKCDVTWNTKVKGKKALILLRGVVVCCSLLKSFPPGHLDRSNPSRKGPSWIYVISLFSRLCIGDNAGRSCTFYRIMASLLIEISGGIAIDSRDDEE